MRPTSSAVLLSWAGTPAFLVTNLTNILYLTGAALSAGAVLVTRKGLFLFVDSRYREASARTVQGCTLRDILDLPATLRRYALCGCEGETVTVAQRDFWKKKYRGTKFLSCTGVVMHFRRSKNADELRHFRRAQKITQGILRRVPGWLCPGLTERELAWKINIAAHDAGADELAFDSIVAFGAHTSRPHHHPTARALKRGDIVQIDMGVRMEGYCADQSRVFFTRKKSPEQERALMAVTKAKEAAEKLVRAGVSTHQLDCVARSVLREYGMEDAFAHALGHGVGLEIHEGVTLSCKRPAEKLLKNEIITIEPGVYFPGKFGIRLEDEIIVQE